MYGPKPRRKPNFSRNRPNGPRTAVLGPANSHVPPAWKNSRANPINSFNALKELGSKAFISNLPVDVKSKDIAELMEHTVGELEDVICVHNTAGKFLGMAIVHFVQEHHAEAARQRYNHKILDNDKVLRVELISDGMTKMIPRPPPPPAKTLLDRLSAMAQISPRHLPPIGPTPSNHRRISQATWPDPPPYYRTHYAPMAQPMRKKGPKRMRKQLELQRITVRDLDAEIEAYKAASPES